MSAHVVVAGASGAIGRPLVPQLIAAGHREARRELAWEPRWPSRRQGFREALG